MMKPLSTAKLQSVREIKKKAKLKKINKTITTIVFILLLLIVVFFSIKFFFIDSLSISSIFSSTQKHSVTELGITFTSYDFGVSDAITILEQDKNITLLYNIPYYDQNYLLTIPDLFYIYPSVFSAKRKNLTMVIGLVDEDNKIVSCFSNLGDIYKNEEISYEECQKVITKENTLINIQYPKENIKETNVYLMVDKKMITIVPKDTEELHIATFLLLKGMYEEFDDIMEKVRGFSIDQDIDHAN